MLTARVHFFMDYSFTQKEKKKKVWPSVCKGSKKETRNENGKQHGTTKTESQTPSSGKSHLKYLKK